MELRHDWTRDEVLELLNLPFLELVYRAQSVHRQYFDPREVQISSLLSIKSGKCPEDCKYCPQSAHHNTGIQTENLLDLNVILRKAKIAKDAGATRFCMGAAWRDPKDKDLPFLVEVIKMVKSLGLETCMTLGMLKEHQAKMLKEAGLDYYNHNIDTSKEFYDQIITTRTFEDRLDTLKIVRDAGIKICSGGIMGMGESLKDRASFLTTLANLDPHPESVPINMLVKVKGTKLEDVPDLDSFEFIKVIAAARILMPKSYVRLSAGRNNLSKEAQAFAIMAGANSIFFGCKLLTTENAEENDDLKLIKELDLKTTVNESLLTPEAEKDHILNAIHKKFGEEHSKDHNCIKLDDIE